MTSASVPNAHTCMARVCKQLNISIHLRKRTTLPRLRGFDCVAMCRFSFLDNGAI